MGKMWDALLELPSDLAGVRRGDMRKGIRKECGVARERAGG